MYKLMFNDNASKVMTDDISDMIRKYTLDALSLNMSLYIFTYPPSG